MSTATATAATSLGCDDGFDAIVRARAPMLAAMCAGADRVWGGRCLADPGEWAELVDAARRGERVALATVYQLSARLILRLEHVTVRPGEIDDLTQCVWLAIADQPLSMGELTNSLRRYAGTRRYRYGPGQHPDCAIRDSHEPVTVDAGLEAVAARVDAERVVVSLAGRVPVRVLRAGWTIVAGTVPGDGDVAALYRWRARHRSRWQHLIGIAA